MLNLSTIKNIEIRKPKDTSNKPEVQRKSTATVHFVKKYRNSISNLCPRDRPLIGLELYLDGINMKTVFVVYN